MSGTYRGYFLAQGQLGVGSLGATYIGANLTFTSIFLILSQESYKRGWWLLVVPIFWIVGTFLFVAAYPRIRPHIIAGRTLHQTLGYTFKSKGLQEWSAIWTIIAFTGTVALEFYGGILLVRWTGLPLVTSITVVLSLAFVVSAFTISGGLRGVAVADVFLDVATFASAAILLVKIWPFPFIDNLQRGLITTTAPATFDQFAFVASMAVLFIPFQFCTLDSWQRLLAWDKKGKSPKSWLLSAGILLAIAYCVPISVGVFVKLHGIKLGSSGQPLEVALDSMHLGAGVLGLSIAGLAGAVLSTADELLNCTSLSLLADYWGIPFSMTRESKESERLAASGKFYTAVFAFLAAGLALLALRFTRELSDMALAIFSAQVVFAWPLAAALLSPELAPNLAKWAVRAMVTSGIAAILLVMCAWIINMPDVAAAAPVLAFVLAGLIFGLPWAFAAKAHKRTARL